MKSKVITAIGSLLFLIIISCQSDEEVEFKRYYSAGSLIYQTRCQNCHGAKGEGLQGLIPPLTDSVFLKSNKVQLPCFIKYGLKGKVTISNRLFEGTMPPNDLAPIEIANVLTYATNSFGNKTGTITSAQVESDLAKCK
jgi:mono/diheme cytochrome c family protein